MYYLVLIFATAALVSVESNIIGVKSSPILKNNIMDNAIQPHAPRTKAQRRLSKLFRVIEHPPGVVHHEPGTVIELTCKVNASPAPSVLWLKNGEPVDGYDEESNDIVPVQPTSLGFLVSTLVISTLSSNPEDVYSCVATSGKRKIEYSTTVFTPQEEFDPLEFSLYEMPRGPRIVYYYSGLFQDIGTDAILPCRVNAHPTASVYWTDKNDDLVFENPRFKVLPSGDLYIYSLRWSDMGDFKCTVKNAFGEETVETFLYTTKPN